MLQPDLYSAEQQMSRELFPYAANKTQKIIITRTSLWEQQIVEQFQKHFVK